MSTSNFDQMDFKDSTTSYLAENYVTCAAAAKDDPNVCDKLLHPDSCKEIVRSIWMFYGRLIVENRVSRPIADACADGVATKNECTSLGNAILNNNPSFCDSLTDKNKKNYCLALVKQDTSLCSDKDCANSIYLMQALKNNDVQQCKKISKESSRWICIGGVTEDVRQCQQIQGFSDFKKSYCAQKAKQKYQDKLKTLSGEKNEKI